MIVLFKELPLESLAAIVVHAHISHTYNLASFVF